MLVCPNCKGSGEIGRSSFANPKTEVVVGCHVCRSQGKIHDKDMHIEELTTRLATAEAFIKELRHQIDKSFMAAAQR